MTEDEAKAKWCPFSQVSAGQSVMGAYTSSNRGGEYRSAKPSACIGTGCMAWRISAPAKVVPVHRVDRDEITHEHRAAEGYCGLAGVASAPDTHDAQAAEAQLAQLGDALRAARAEIATLKESQTAAARRLQIEAFEAETNRLKAMRS